MIRAHLFRFIGTIISAVACLNLHEPGLRGNGSCNRVPSFSKANHKSGAV